MLDLLLIAPGGAHGIYGNDLAESIIAREPPTWCRMIAGYIRDRGFSVEILDAEVSPIRGALIASAKLVAIVVAGHQPSASTQQMVGARAIAQAIRRVDPYRPIVMLGNHPSALPERTLREEPVDYVIDGEGPMSLLGLLKGDAPAAIPGLVWRATYSEAGHHDQHTIVQNPLAPLIEDLDRDLHGDAWDLLPMDSYRAHNWHGLTGPRQPYASIYTTLGCPFKCLAGDTPVDTIYGPIPIKELADQGIDVPIFTYDRETRRGKVATARNIKRYGTGQRLVRVHFDDGSHVDVTPDHGFLVFKWGNGSTSETEWIEEAANLTPGAHVRAIKFEHRAAYPQACWSRRGRAAIHRMVAEWTLRRPLAQGEHVHHIDHDRMNWEPDNLHVYGSAKEHFASHPEIAKRMRLANPARKMTAEWRQKITIAQTGLRRSPEAKENYRRAALEREQAKRERRPAGLVNHRVSSVEPLDGLHDVYCLEVPETGWFYANGVLVKNCSFCMINTFQHANRYRRHSPEFVVDQIERLHLDHGVRSLKIADEMFVLNEDHYMGIAERLAAKPWASEMNIWAYARVDTVKTDTLALLRRAGIRWLALGIESGSSHVRDGAQKRLRTNDIVGTVQAIQAAGICVVGNYIFGLPDDNLVSMQETLDLALYCQTEWANFYCAMAYPGSQLYDEAIEKGWALPDSWRGFSQHNDDCRPLDTQHLGAADVLRFRDVAFRIYFRDEGYRRMLEKRLGPGAVSAVDQMLKYDLPRKLLAAGSLLAIN